jgi:uncharacterized protein (TIGR00369 family)
LDADGLRESLRSHFAGSFVFELGATILSASPDHVCLELAMRAGLATPEGGTHGAVLSGLAMCAGAALAQLHLAAGERASTFQSASNMVGSISEGTLLATATPVHLGSKTLVIQSRVTDKASGRLLCQSSQTLMRLTA